MVASILLPERPYQRASALTGPLCVALLVASSVVVALGAPVAAASKKLPDACALITKADVATAFAKLEPALQPTSISDPVGSAASTTGRSCETQLVLPNSVAGKVLVQTSTVSKKAPCPNPAATGKKVTISKTKALLEPTPRDAKVVRDVTFVDQGACALILIQLSGGSAKVPESVFVDLADAALAKKAGSTASSSSKAACTLVTKADAAAALGQPVNDNGATPTSSCEYRETSGSNSIKVTVASGQTASDLQRVMADAGPLQPLSGLGDAAYLGPSSVMALKGDVSVRIEWLGGASPNTAAALKQLEQTAIGRL